MLDSINQQTADIFVVHSETFALMKHTCDIEKGPIKSNQQTNKQKVCQHIHQI